MQIAQHKDRQVMYGDGPDCSKARAFLDPEHAERFLREFVAVEDLKAHAPSHQMQGNRIVPAVVEIEERDGEPRIIPARAAGLN